MTFLFLVMGMIGNCTVKWLGVALAEIRKQIIDSSGFIVVGII